MAANIVKCGYVTRHSEKTITKDRWKESWLQLYRDSTLRVYKKQDASTIKFSIPLKDVCREFAFGEYTTAHVPGRPVLRDGASYKCILGISWEENNNSGCYARTNWFLFSSEHELHEWVSAICRALCSSNRLQAPPPPPPPPSEPRRRSRSKSLRWTKSLSFRWPIRWTKSSTTAEPKNSFESQLDLPASSGVSKTPPSRESSTPVLSVPPTATTNVRRASSSSRPATPASSSGSPVPSGRRAYSVPTVTTVRSATLGTRSGPAAAMRHVNGGTLTGGALTPDEFRVRCEEIRERYTRQAQLRRGAITETD